MRGRGLAALLWVALFPFAYADIKSSAGNIVFDVNADGTGEFDISTTGLGIGTTSPSTNLHVAGNAFFSSSNLGIGTSAPISSLEVSGTLGMTPQSVTANTTLSGNSVVLADSSASNITLTLPYAGNVAGRTYIIKKTVSGNTVKIKGGGNAIDSYSELNLTTSSSGYPFASLISNGTQWYVTSMSSNGISNFSPTSVSASLLCWLDADDSANVTLTNGNVSTWTDKSGKGNSLTQATATLQPLYRANTLNGKYVVRFDGSNDYLKKTMNNNYATVPADVYIVAQYTSTPSSNEALLDDGQTTQQMRVMRNTNSRLIMQGGGTGLISATTNLTTFHIWHFAFDSFGGTLKMHIDGGNTVSASQGSGPSGNGLILGSDAGPSNYAPVDVAEVLMYTSLLGNADRQDVERYLSAKWAIAGP